MVHGSTIEREREVFGSNFSHPIANTMSNVFVMKERHTEAPSAIPWKAYGSPGIYTAVLDIDQVLVIIINR